jgi:hypothetical protein
MDEPSAETQAAIENYTHRLFSDVLTVRYDDGTRYADGLPAICIVNPNYAPPLEVVHRLRFEAELKGLSTQEIFAKLGELLCAYMPSVRRRWDAEGRSLAEDE